MDNNNIRFVGYCDPATIQKAIKQRENPMRLESFCTAVNQDTDSGYCSCCKQEVRVYAMMQYSLPIEPSTLSLCEACIRKVPDALEVHNLYSNGAPPLLAYKINNSEV